MGTNESVNKDELNDSFPDDYIVIKTKEDLIEDNKINFEKLIERRGDGIIIQSQIIDGKIVKQVFKKKNLLDKESLERFERLEKERLERLENERKEKERLENERKEKERLEKERIEKERLEKERLEKERLEKERLEKERIEKERLEKERIEKERLARLEKERLERLEKERLERLEKERLARLEKERLERLEKERLEKERIEKERIEKERLERLKKERLEKERIEKERIEKIKKRVFETKQNYYKVINNITQEKTIDTSLIEDMNEMGVIMKQQIIEDQQINPQNYINIDQTVKSSSDQNFPIALLAKNLELNGITTAIQKKSTNQDLTKTCLQLMTNGLVTKQKCEVKFDFGEKKNDEIINDPNERNKFINEWKTKISKKLGVNPEDIIITNLRKGSLEADIFLRQNENFEGLASTLTDLSKDSPKIKQIKTSTILKGIVLSPEMFDVRGNQSPNNYEKQGYRGGKIYKGPIGWTGHGLRVWSQYDGGDNTWLGMTGNAPGEWCVAYHGTSIGYAKSILINNFKVGARQACENHDDLNHPGQKVGKGVYVTPEISEAEGYAKSDIIQGYICVFMCRVNPINVRISKQYPSYWVVNGTSDDIRPYRLLIKYVGKNNYF